MGGLVVSVVMTPFVHFWGRQWNLLDILTVATFLTLHGLCLFAPFHFTWAAFWLAVALNILTGLGVTMGFHRNLAHKSFRIPKWLEYLLAYLGVLALQYGGLKNVEDMKKQWFYRFLHRTFLVHIFISGALLYALGGLPFFIWGMGVRMVYVFHTTMLVNSAGHIWGKQVWNTGDMSKNNWLLGWIALGEGWHNNHHAFEYSARQGLEWWQVDLTWYVIRALQAIGLATNVKAPTDSQMRRKALK